MASSPPMIQLYQDEERSVSVFAPEPVNAPQPRWAKQQQQQSKGSRLRRLTVAFGALFTIYLILCAWFIYAQGEVYDSNRGPSEEDFPHRKFPWPFPRHPHHPHRRPPFPHIKVLACTAVPTPSPVSPLTSVELNVTLPCHKAVILHDRLIHGDVSVTKVEEVNDVTTLSKGKNLTVGITVANRTCPHHPPTSAVEEHKEAEEKKFVLCAITFAHPKHKPHSGEEVAEEDTLGHPHRRHRHHSPPVIVTVLPALNATYPKLPGPHHPPPGHPPHDSPDGEGDDEGEDEDETEIVHFSQTPSSVFSRAWRSMVSFLFPMLPVIQEPFPQHWPHHHHGHPHRRPPFVVTSLTVTVSKHVPVKYGLPFKPHGRRWRH